MFARGSDQVPRITMATFMQSLIYAPVQYAVISCVKHHGEGCVFSHNSYCLE